MQNLTWQETPQSLPHEGGNLIAPSHHSSTALSAPLSSRTEHPPQTKTPILIFEWELPSEERTAHNGQDIAVDESPENPLRWIGNIEAFLGYKHGEFAHTLEAWCDTLAPEDCERVLNAIEHHLSTGEPYFEICRARRRDGTWLQFVQSGIATRDEAGNPWKFTGTMSDVVVLEDHKTTGPNFPIQQQLQQNCTQLPNQVRSEQQEKARAEALLRTAAHLNAQLNLKDVCEAICEAAAQTLRTPAAVMLFNKMQDAFVPAATQNMPEGYASQYIPTPRSTYDSHVAEKGPLFLFNDVQERSDLTNHQLYREVETRTIGIASLIREGEVLGLLKVYSFGEPRNFDENELAFLQGLADQGAQAISNARFYADSQRRMSKLQSLHQIDRTILSSSEVNVSLNVVLEELVSQLGVDAASILLLNSHTLTLRYAGGRGFRTASPRRAELNLGEGLAGRAALEQRLIYVPDLSRPDVIAAAFTVPELHLPRLNLRRSFPSQAVATGIPLGRAESNEAPHSPRSRRSGIMTGESFVSYYAVPLIISGQVKGILEVWHRSRLELDEEELGFVESLAGQAAIAVDNATLFRDVQRSNDELMLAYDSTLEGWSRALDLRDKETEGHSQRVTNETLRLARQMGIPDEELMQIRRGALLHDIGKMGIPDAILLKPGKLTDEEWVVMKKHPTYALELLSPIPYLRSALEIPYCHHEKWDGSGYPRGISGEQIPLSARIFAIIDVWDALSSDRPYRKGWPLARVLKHIKEGAGTHFDPQVVDAFLEMHGLAEDVAVNKQGEENAPFQATNRKLNTRIVRNPLLSRLFSWLAI